MRVAPNPLGACFRCWPLARFIAVRFAVSCAWYFVAMLFASHWFGGAEGRLLTDSDFWWSILFSFAIGVSIVIGLTLSRLIGPRGFRNFLLGRYHPHAKGRAPCRLFVRPVPPQSPSAT